MDTICHVSQPEYLLLMGLLDAQMALGVEWPDEGQSAASSWMGEAFRSLVNKGYLDRDGDQVSLNPDVDHLFSVCAAPQYSFVSTYMDGGSPDVRFMHVEGECVVEDKRLPSKDRNLSGIYSSEQMVKRLVAQFHLHGQRAAVGEPFSVSTVAFEAAVGCIAEGEQAIAARLQQMGVADEARAFLVHALSVPVAHAAISKVSLDASALRLSYGVLDLGGDGLWEMRFLDDLRVRFKPIDATGAIEAIREYVA